MHFYQLENPDNINAGYAGGDVDKVISGLHLILSRGHEHIANPELKDRIDEIHQNVRDGYRLHLVTSGTNISTIGAKLEAFISGLNAPSESFFEWQVEDIKGLQDTYYRKNLPTLERLIHLDLDQMPYLVRSDNHTFLYFSYNRYSFG